mmetsp:Transcript_55587/g.119998  ORF Transcript_55587/g.119998 Transcript_55587/m.119998 type:complete len:409 (-) Transcript_55587:51-1277(-)
MEMADSGRQAQAPDSVANDCSQKGPVASGRPKQLMLVGITVLIDALAPIVQEHASRSAGFEGSAMVLMESMCYVVGGLLMAVALGGIGGFWRCVQPLRYVAYLPASVAFSSSNFLTYMAVRGLGASQFYLLAQVRVAVLAVFLRVWSGTRQTPLGWLALTQLVAGMVVLVVYKASGGSCDMAAIQSVSASATWDEQVEGFLALIGVILTSSFAVMYLEWQLKSSAQDTLYVQLHQMNFFGACATLLIFLGSRKPVPDLNDLGGVSALQGNASGFESAAIAVAEELSAAASKRLAEAPPMAYSSAIAIMTVIVARGIMSSLVLKRLDCIAKGLIDVTAIVVCTGIQIVIDGSVKSYTVIGIQVLMLLSVLNYILAQDNSGDQKPLRQPSRRALRPDESCPAEVAPKREL